MGVPDYVGTLPCEQAPGECGCNCVYKGDTVFARATKTHWCCPCNSNNMLVVSPDSTGINHSPQRQINQVEHLGGTTQSVVSSTVVKEKILHKSVSLNILYYQFGTLINN